MALLTPAPLTQVWNVLHGLTRFFTSSPCVDIQIALDALLRCGRFEQVGNDDVGCTLIKFDADTGQPLGFVSHLIVNADTPVIHAAVYYPDELAVTVLGTYGSGTGARVFGQRIAVDVAALTFTAGPLALWDLNAVGATVDLVGGNFASSSSVNVFAAGPFGARMSTLNLTAGTASASVDYTPAAIVGAGYDRFQISIATVDGHGAVAISAYLDSTGVGLARTFHFSFGSTPGTATDLNMGRLTGSAANVASISKATTIKPVAFDFGTFPDRILSQTGLLTPTQSEVRTAATVLSSSLRSTNTTTSRMYAANREGASISAFNAVVLREFLPTTGAETRAWDYPTTIGSIDNIERVGMLTSNARFFWLTTNTSARFRVYSDPAWVPNVALRPPPLFIPFKDRLKHHDE